MPTRRTYAVVAIALMAFTVYVSLLPFRLQAVPWDVAWTHFSGAMTAWPRRVPRANFLANLLLFVPIGFGLAGAWLTDRPRRRFAGAVLVALPLSLLVSFGAEFAQEFAPGRVTSVMDVVAQTLGCGVGLVLWAGGGQALTAWIRESRGTVHHDRLTRVLVAYAALWLFANLAPFDITLDVERLGRRLRDGSISVVPFAAPWTPRLWWDVVVTAVSSVPLGLAALFAGGGSRGRRGALASVCLGVAGVAAVELAHVFIRSHAADATDLVSGAVGVACGAWVGGRIRPAEPAHVVAGPSSATRWAWAGLVLWCLMLAGYHWQPFDFGLDQSLLRQKLSRISLVPFSAYRRSGSDLAALNTLIAKIGMSIPLGVIAAFGLPRLLTPVVVASCVLGAGAVFGAIELGQFFVPSRVPDPTDVWLGVAASAGGLWLGRWVRTGYQSREQPRGSEAEPR